MIGRGDRITTERVSLVDDSGDVQMVQTTEAAVGASTASRVLDKVRRVSEFGFASVPPIGSEVVVWRRLAQRALSLVLGTSHRPSRPKGLQPGDAGIYDVRGAKVMMTADGLLIDCAGLPAVVQNASMVTLRASDRVTLDAPTVACTGDLTVEGHSFLALRTAYNGHKHTGVAAGGASSGTTDTPT